MKVFPTSDDLTLWKEGMVAQRNGGRERLLMYGETSTPVYKRLMKPEDGMRPQLLNLHSCHTILIEGVLC